MDWTRIISAGVGPIIVISACGLLCLAFYNRLTAMVSRWRSMHREQIEETENLTKSRRQGGSEADLVRSQELLGMLQVQTQRVRHRARLVRDSLMCLLATIGCLTLCSLCLGLGVVWPAMSKPAAVLFVVGMCTLLLAVGFAMAELRQALDPVELESRFVREMSREVGV